MDTVDGKVESSEATGQKTSPPPVIILRTQMEVAEQDGGLGAGDDQDHKHEEQKSIHVINLTGPNTVEDEEQLDEDASEGEDPAHDDARDGLGVDGLVRDLPGDLVGAHRLLHRGLPEPEVSADEGERHGDAEPERQQRHQREEGDGGGGSLVPQHQVQHEEVAEHDAGAQHRGQQHVALPLLAPE